MVRNSPVIHGRQAILDWWRAYFSEPKPYPPALGSRYAPMGAILIIDEIRMMAPDVALINRLPRKRSHRPGGGSGEEVSAGHSGLTLL